ncbi:hypothetical protein CP532_5458 [Ophiocordyceps camponoti-leonardi (nom. inval.)]|nr:hypothetical protein CP532_5458 [Ophiocordyceps camponoti-leonardi (nom. inval.)]
MNVNLRQLGQQVRVLCRKNLLLIAVRRPISFVLLTYAVPLALLALLLSIPSFFSFSNVYGIGTPAPIRPLASTVQKKLVVVRPSYVGPDVDRVIDTFTKPVDKGLLQFIEDERELTTLCLANSRGVSDCHAAVIFRDSPDTKGLSRLPLSDNVDAHTWQYLIRADPANGDYNFNVPQHKTDQENLYLPLQLAINNAITNSSVTPEAFMFTSRTNEDAQSRMQLMKASLIAELYTFALTACHFFTVYRLTAFVTAERESGMSQLVDAMGGGTATAARILSWLIVFDLGSLPCFIGTGLLFWRLLFPTLNGGLVIGWQILSGLAINNSALFAAAFFRKSRVSAIYVVGVCLVMSVIAQFYTFQDAPPTSEGAHMLSLLFPSANHVFFTQHLMLQEGMASSNDSFLSPRLKELMMMLSPGSLVAILVLNIFMYPLLAFFVERAMHGIYFRKRFFTGTSETTDVVAETVDLGKTFTPNWLERFFCCGRRKQVKAVDDVNLKGHRGQILCLLGLNGSGKTTMLHMISGLTNPTTGEIRINARPSQIGICPQRNTFWDDLTVGEHVWIWSQLKAGSESSEELDRLIADCDLDMKQSSQAKTLSGGQKRKLQLACMFVGDSSLCLVDECTSGLDPLSRRSIWEILLKQRSKRSIFLTTHFLDEADVMADHIVILSHGKVRCQGAVAELKSLYGGSYKVAIPLAGPRLEVEYPSTTHQDSLVYSVPDSSSTAELCSRLDAAGVQDVAVAGPQVEDVFLNLHDDEPAPAEGKISDSEFQMTSGRVISFWHQVWLLIRKRGVIFERFWWPYVWAIILPLAITPFLIGLLPRNFKPPSCDIAEPEQLSQFKASYFGYEGDCSIWRNCPTIIVAPPSNRDVIGDLIRKQFNQVSRVQESHLGDFAIVRNGRQEMIDAFRNREEQDVSQEKAPAGGIFIGSGGEAPVLAGRIDSWGGSTGTQILNLYSQMQSGVEITSETGQFVMKNSLADAGGLPYALFFTLLQAIYPAAFVLYPAIEKSRKVRALQYANGVRRGPLWVAYTLFDFHFVLSVAIGLTVTMSQLVPWQGPIGVMMPVLALYGLSSMLLGYVISHFTKGPLSAFFAAFSTNFVMFVFATIAFGLSLTYGDTYDTNSIALGVTYGLNLLLPIGNVFRALMLGLNVLRVGCSDGQPTSPGSINGFGGPILYLVIQAAVLLLVMIWIEGDLALFRRRPRGGSSSSSNEKETPEIDDKKRPSRAVEVETERVDKSESDLMRALHVSKRFGRKQALDDVTLGVVEGEVMALLGPNGAGKSTLVNIIQTELSADEGRVLLLGNDSRTREAQKHIGVCPQFDALDIMSTRKHLEFYARIKGITDVTANVDAIMAKLGLTPYAAMQASKLSGGNKRKLSLAIALMGMPPVLILDEPTSAMDAIAKRAFWSLIRPMTANCSVLLTTHSMEEADSLATRVAILSRHLLAIGTTRALRQLYGDQQIVTIQLATAPRSSDEEMERVRDWLLQHFPTARLDRDMLGGQLRFVLPASQRLIGARVIELVERHKEDLGIVHYSVGAATLDDVFLNVVGENKLLEDEESASNTRRWMRFLR